MVKPTGPVPGMYQWTSKIQERKETFFLSMCICIVVTNSVLIQCSKQHVNHRFCDMLAIPGKPILLKTNLFYLYVTLNNSILSLRDYILYSQRWFLDAIFVKMKVFLSRQYTHHIVMSTKITQLTLAKYCQAVD